MKYKCTLKLQKLFEKKAEPELILEYIYINIFQLIKEINKYYYEIDGGSTFSHHYEKFYREVIQNSAELWLKTIFPPYINGFKNFYQGIAGRLEYFSINLEDASEKVNNIGNNWDIYYRYHLHLILSQTPDTYYWYGNPINWAYCYDIQLVYYYYDMQRKLYLPDMQHTLYLPDIHLDSKKEILIKKRQFIFIDNSQYDSVKEIMFDGKETVTDLNQIFVVYKAKPENYKFVEGVFPYPDPMRRFYRSDKEDISNMVASYKDNVTTANGYNFEIAKVWDEYNKKKEEKIKSLIEKDISGKLHDFKIKSEEENKQLEEEFLLKYK